MAVAQLLAQFTCAPCSSSSSSPPIRPLHKLNSQQCPPFLLPSSLLATRIMPQPHRPKRLAAMAFANWAPDANEADLREFSSWLKQQGFPDQIVELKQSEHGDVGCFATRDLQAGEVAVKVPENYTVTCVDVTNHPVISKLAAGRPDLIGLALWLVYEKGLGKKSVWYPYIKTLPSTTLSPLVWSNLEQDKLLKGTSVSEEVRQRSLYLEGELTDIFEAYGDQLKELPPNLFTVEAFKNAFSVIASRALFLASAELYALVPFGDAVNFSGDCTESFEYSTEEQEVVLRADRSYAKGQQIYVSYGQNRPNSDLLISYGLVDEHNSNDFIELEVGLVKDDPLRGLKLQILQQANLQDEQTFPLYYDRFPTQLLTYMRLARLKDSGMIAKIVFDKDVIVDQANEYEVLTLLLTECRTRLSNFDRSLDDEIRLVNSKDISPKENVAAKIRMCEQKILNNTMAALRNRLTPIRGIPTKGGSLKDPNSDIKDMFNVMEQVASAPQKFLSNFMKDKN